MKYKFLIVYFLLLLGTLAICQKSPGHSNNLVLGQTDTIAIASKILTLSDAEKIMGERAKLTGDTFIKKGDTVEYKCDYTALSQDVISGKTGKLYFMYEVYNGVASATHAYSAIYQGNMGHDGVKVVPGLGSEAYYQTDQTGFYFFLVRKSKKMFRMKLNKITSHSSEEEFKKVTRRIEAKL